ncbi:MAG: Spo0E family sporulation regulatory protein-aspartic acid phosphatase [Syntrophomonadaceae bacterium]|jgi:hypothetical protein
MQATELQKQIERLRQELHRQGKEKGLQHRKTIETSQMLDRLIIQYYSSVRKS